MDNAKGRVAGHSLRSEGRPYAVNEYRRVMRLYDGRMGRALCSCGALSGLLDSNAARQRWHRAHKAAVQVSEPPVR